ncbi:MAG: hypothetical protein HOY44_10070 [Maritimibacter sp.]|uniref:hypothetical protein n=1 Tax=Maritimibacter sp. TaxID=2003363 RepID=UPI001E0CB9BD|nr:hypothetical protein [Maritimibacter sp.]MBL6427859.1 hypothetical protein [Maritimibacter sp.]
MNIAIPNYTENRAWSDTYLPDVKRIVGSHLLSAAPDDIDMQQATDLLMLDARDMRVAARVRRPGYADRFPYEFTVRSRIPSGGETELSKIINGYGDWMFYGHADPRGGIGRWWLLDLRAFRAALIRPESRARLHWGSKDNADGTRFTWFDIRSFPNAPDIVVAASL